jgi:hypothetical protein
MSHRLLAPLALLVLAACAPRAATPETSPAALAATPAGRAATAAPTVTCPEDIVREPVLGAGVYGMEAGQWVQDLSLERLAGLGETPGARSTLALAIGPLQLVTVNGRALARTSGLAVLREHPQGACVVNSWGVYVGEDATLQAAGSWKSADGRLAVLLLSLVVPREGEPPEQRWMVLATNGRRLWPAVGDADQQLTVRGAALKERGGQLQLELRQARTTVYAFDPRTGRFVTH